jgi:hypothetical protein
MQVNGQQAVTSPTVDVTNTMLAPIQNCEGQERDKCVCTSRCNQNPKSFCIWVAGKFENPDTVTEKCVCAEPGLLLLQGPILTVYV